MKALRKIANVAWPFGFAFALAMIGLAEFAESPDEEWTAGISGVPVLPDAMSSEPAPSKDFRAVLGDIRTTPAHLRDGDAKYQVI